MIELDLSTRRVLVTGAGRNIGRAIALAFGAAGADVVVNDLDGRHADAVVDELRAAGGAGRSAAFDVTDLDAVRSAVEEVGPVDVLVNNAGNAGADGFGSRAPFAETEPADWEPFLQVNLHGTLHCCRAVLPQMIASGWGRIVTVVSDAGRTGDPGGAVYGAAKAAAAALTRSIAIENGRHGITANNISLGTMRTEATEAMWADPDNAVAASLMRSYAIRRPGEPADVAGLAVFLASDLASWITGQTYPLNGGFSFAL